MTLSVNTRQPIWDDALTYAGQDLRLLTSTLLSALGAASGNGLGIGSGVRAANGSPLKVQTTSGLSVSIAPGCSAIQGSAALNAGTYTVVLDSTATLTCTAADTVNSRIDSMCLTAVDLGSSSSNGVVQIITGTPASSPTAPALPANSLLLCNITVPANATALTGGDLSDQRQFLAAAGGIKNYLNSSLWPTVGDVSHYAHDSNTERFKRFNGTTLIAPSTVGFAPVSSGAGNATANSTTAVTACSATVTVDGFTTVKLIVAWKVITSSGTSTGNGCVVLAERGSTTIAEIVKIAQSSNGSIDGGGITWFDPTPAAGTYTYSIQIANQGAGSFTLTTCSLELEAQPS